MDFTLLRDYFGQSCEGWLMSEKFDGWRGKKGGLSAYAEAVGRPLPIIHRNKDGAEVMDKLLSHDKALEFSAYLDKAAHLATIHSLPQECWKECAEYVVAQGLSAKETQERVNDGGEGLVIRNPRGLYRFGERSDDVLRLVPQNPAVNRRRVAA